MKNFIHAEEEITGKIGGTWSFERAVDHQRVPDHIYYEGYGHLLPTSESALSLNPRNWFKEMDKQPGPKRIAAFVGAFKELNKETFKMAFKTQEGEERNYYEELFDMNYHLADLAMQFHFGDEITPDDICWHNDAHNSALHMGISLMGERSLHMNRTKEGHTVHHQSRGDFYIGTPTSVKHAVEYPQTTYESRILAAQARFLITPRKTPEDLERFSSLDMPLVMSRVCHHLECNEIVVPSLEQVKHFFQSF